MHWNVRAEPSPTAALVRSARNGCVEVALEQRLVSGEVWLRLASGGWVRQRHRTFMMRTFGQSHEYGWYPEAQLSSGAARQDERQDVVAIPSELVLGQQGLGYALMLQQSTTSRAFQRTLFGP